jgi:hypothetical protein
MSQRRRQVFVPIHTRNEKIKRLLLLVDDITQSTQHDLKANIFPGLPK